jgi:hypothetical protein
MYLRRWISWLAIAAILLHTATIAGHGVIMFNRAAAEVTAAALEAGLICHVEGDGLALPGNGQGGPSKPCPICLGLASAFALHDSGAPVLHVPRFAALAAPAAYGPALKSSHGLYLPLSRGPPSLA